jgi:uncharacterized protein (TIGR03084 family)
VPTVDELCGDLTAEQSALDATVGNLTDEAWLTPTPASGWDVRDSISHLCYFDETATLAITDPDAFAAHKSNLIAAMTSAEAPDVALGRQIDNPRDLLSRWRTSRAGYLDATRAAASGRSTPPRVPWYGPSMSLASFTTARIMETWAHGQDIRDALDGQPEISPRLRHIIHIGVGARAYSFAAHGVADPGDPVALKAFAPDGEVWTWGPDESVATNRISGTAVDLALVFTQRRHTSRTGVVASGPVAQQWLAIAQAFAGAPTITSEDR